MISTNFLSWCLQTYVQSQLPLPVCLQVSSIPSCFLLGLTQLVIVPPSLSNFPSLHVYCLFPLGCEMFSVFPVFAFPIFTNHLCIKSGECAIVLIVLILLISIQCIFFTLFSESWASSFPTASLPLLTPCSWNSVLGVLLLPSDILWFQASSAHWVFIMCHDAPGFCLAL